MEIPARRGRSVSDGEGPERTRYTTIDYMSGLIAPLVNLVYAEKIRAGFQLAADGLKAYAERRTSPA